MSQGLEILLVEDNPKDVELAVHALRKHNLANRVHVARDGQEALDFFFGPGAPQARPRLVLLDLKLPKVTGLEVLARLKAEPATHAIPVVVMTSSTIDEDMREAYRLGANSYLRKPIDFGEFMECAKTIGLYWLLLNRTPEG